MPPSQYSQESLIFLRPLLVSCRSHNSPPQLYPAISHTFSPYHNLFLSWYSMLSAVLSHLGLLWVKNGRRNGKEKEYLDNFQRPWTEDFLYIFLKGLKSTTLIFCHRGLHRVNPNWEADKHRAVTCTDSLMIRGQWWIMGWIILHCFLRIINYIIFTLCKVNSCVCGIPTWVLYCDSYVFAEYEWMYSFFV